MTSESQPLPRDKSPHGFLAQTPPWRHIAAPPSRARARDRRTARRRVRPAFARVRATRMPAGGGEQPGEGRRLGSSESDSHRVRLGNGCRRQPKTGVRTMLAAPAQISPQSQGSLSLALLLGGSVIDAAICADSRGRAGSWLPLVPWLGDGGGRADDDGPSDSDAPPQSSVAQRRLGRGSKLLSSLEATGIRVQRRICGFRCSGVTVGRNGRIHAIRNVYGPQCLWAAASGGGVAGINLRWLFVHAAELLRGSLRADADMRTEVWGPNGVLFSAQNRLPFKFIEKACVMYFHIKRWVIHFRSLQSEALRDHHQLSPLSSFCLVLVYTHFFYMCVSLYERSSFRLPGLESPSMVGQSTARALVSARR